LILRGKDTAADRAFTVESHLPPAEEESTRLHIIKAKISGI
jgi:hypothetical protein